MELEEYKKNAWEWLTRTYGNPEMETSQKAMEESFKALGLESNEDWEAYVDDFPRK